MSRIILDTSVLVPDYRLRSLTLRAVLRAAGDLGDDLLIPRLVLDELINKFREDLEAASHAFARTRGRLFGLLDRKRTSHRVNVERHVAAYSTWLNSELNSKKVKILDYPTCDHRDVVARALHRRRPFSADGQRGYRDALIWETILRSLRFDWKETFFVSTNTRDFADPQDSGRLHPDLLQELESLQKGRVGFAFFPGLEELLAGGVAPRQKLLPRIKSEIELGRLGNRKLRTWLLDILPTALNRARDRWAFTSRRGRDEDWAIGHIHSLKQVTLSSTSTLTETSILVILFVYVVADLVPRQPELGTDVASDYGIANPTVFVAFISAELELETNAILTVEVDRVTVLEEGTTKVRAI
jgi:predicted nucleic acid-binding protein